MLVIGVSNGGGDYATSDATVTDTLPSKGQQQGTGNRDVVVIDIVINAQFNRCKTLPVVYGSPCITRSGDTVDAVITVASVEE